MIMCRLHLERATEKSRIVNKLIFAIFLVSVSLSTSFAVPSWKFIVTGDSLGLDNGLNATILGELATEVVNHDVDFLLFSGGLVYGNLQTFESRLIGWREVMKPVYDANIAVYACRGNHEDSSGGEDVWQRVFSDLPDNGPANEKHLTYSVTHKNALVIGLDEYINRHQVNQAWLDIQLGANRQPHVFAFGHAPAFQAYHKDCLDDDPDKRDILWASIRNAGGRVYFCGHDHFYDHARVNDGDGDPNNDIHQYIIGTAGANFYGWMPPYDGNNSNYTVEQLFHNAIYGYVLADINELDVTLTWMQRNITNSQMTVTYEPTEVWSYTIPSITLLCPDGGESLIASSQYDIKWKTYEDPNIAYVLIEYSTDNGQNWNEVNTVTNSGSYEWIIPTVDSNECLVRVSALNNPIIYDTSHTVFTIFQCQGPIVGDINDDCYVDFLDLAALLANWLECGNPFDSNCASK